MAVAIGDDVAHFEGLLAALVEDRFASRLFDRDAALWGASAEAEASVRLGWTDFSRRARELPRIVAGLREQFDREGVDRFVLCGMGGSSLAPAVIARWAGVELSLLDSTHPEVVRRELERDLSRTAVIVSSKSGSTIETRSHLSAFERAFRDADIDPATRIVVITDAESPLQHHAERLGYRVLLADPEVGGRFSALTAFGLVPAGLAGASVGELLDEARSVRDALAQDSERNPALRLAAAIVAGLPDRRILAVDEAPQAAWGLGAWIEQLVAESTGKQGNGVLPIALPADAWELRRRPAIVLPVRLAEAAPQPENSGVDHLERDAHGVLVAAPLGAQLLIWQVATAALGKLMGIDPFDQPDVESAKAAARASLIAARHEGGADPAPLPFPGETIAALRASLRPGGYLAIQAYLDTAADYVASVHLLRERLAQTLEIPVALGWGPSYLHSTGQLHKGGPADAVFLQLNDASARPFEIPGSEAGFETLILAQARGDEQVLRALGRTVIVLDCSDPAAAIAGLLNEL